MSRENRHQVAFLRWHSYIIGLPTLESKLKRHLELPRLGVIPSVKILRVSVLGRTEDFIFAVRFSRNSFSSFDIYRGLQDLEVKVFPVT